MTPNELVEQYRPLAIATARRFAWRWPAHAEDFASEALLALVECSRRYDGTRGIKFGTFARQRIIGACLDYQLTLKRPESKARAAAHHRRNGKAIAPRGVDVVHANCEAVALRERLLASLPEVQRRMVQLVLIDQMFQRRAGALVGLKQPRCSLLLKEARSRMAEVLNELRLAEARR